MKKVLLFAIMLIGLTFASCKKEVIEPVKIDETCHQELTFVGEHNLENGTSGIVSEFKNDLGSYTYIQSALGTHVIGVASLIGESDSDLDISIEPISHPSGTATVISARDISFNSSTGEIYFSLVVDAGISVASIFRFQLRVK